MTRTCYRNRRRAAVHAHELPLRQALLQPLQRVVHQILVPLGTRQHDVYVSEV